MRRIVAAAVGLAALAAGLHAGSQPVPAAQQTGAAAISGVVTDAATGRPIAGATVSLTSPGPDGQLLRMDLPSVLSDGRGRFVFVNLPSAPTYRVRASANGYEAGGYLGPATPGRRATRPPGESIPIRLADAGWMRSADIALWRLGSISGRVVDERGEAVVGTAVRVFAHRVVAGHERLMPGAVVATDDRGDYRIASVQPGSYLVGVLSVQATAPASSTDVARPLPLGGLLGRGERQPPIGAAEVRGAGIDVDGRHRLVLTNFATPPPPGSGRSRAYAPVYFPDGRTPAEAQAIQLDAGTSRAGVDFRLAPVDTATISGRVTGAVDGTADMLLRLMAPGTEHLGFGSEVATTIVEADGTFTFLNVPAGGYTLLASSAVPEISASAGGGLSDAGLPESVGYGSIRGLSAGYPATPRYVMWWRSAAGATVWGRLAVSVGATDQSGLELPLRTSSSVRGRIVRDDPESPDSSRRFNITLEPADGDPSLGVPSGWTDAYDETFAFAIEGLAGGRYLIRLSPYQFGWRVASAMANGVDLAETGVDGSLGLDYDDVVVTVTRSGAQLSGVVRGEDRQPTPATVALFPTDPQQWVDYGLTPDRLKATSTEADGAYGFSALPDGEYFVIAVRSSLGDDWPNPAFLEAAAKLATRVTLAARTPASHDLSLSEVAVR